MTPNDARGIARAVQDSAWEAVRATAGFSHGIVSQADSSGRTLSVERSDGALQEIPNVGASGMTTGSSALLMHVGGELEGTMVIARSAWVQGEIEDYSF